jgi:hypothetical protein
MPAPIRVDDLINQVRDQIDEANTDTVSDADILEALNRGQRHATNITAKHYKDMFLERITFSSSEAKADPFQGDLNSFDISEKTFGMRIVHVMVIQNKYEYPLRREDYRQLHRYSSTAQVQIPSIYAIVGKQIVIKPTPSTNVTFAAYIFREPETLVKSQGRITAIDTDDDYYLVDALGDDLTTSIDDLNAFINVVDAQTGKVKVSHQISAIDTTTKQISIKTSSLDRTTLYGKTIATAVPTTEIELDDYICIVKGSAVSEFPQAYQDFQIQYAVAEITRRLGGTVEPENFFLEKLEKEVERMWVGREASKRVARRNKHWLRS